MLKRAMDEETYHENQLLLQSPQTLVLTLLSRLSLIAFDQGLRSSRYRSVARIYLKGVGASCKGGKS